MQKGFTLIETLLVVAIAAMLAAVGVMAFRQQSEQARANKVALEVEHVLEAGMAYYEVHEQQWPVQDDTEFEQNFLPNGVNTSSVGGRFQYGFLGNDGRRFYVALAVPHDIGKQVTAKIANAVYVHSPQDPTDICQNNQDCYVHAEVPVPGVSSVTGQKTTLVDVGVLHMDGGQTHSISFTCPNGRIGQLMVLPFNFDAGNYKGETKSYAVHDVSTSTDASSDQPAHCQQTDTNQWTCDYALEGQIATGKGLVSMNDPNINAHINAYYLALCKLPA